MTGPRRGRAWFADQLSDDPDIDINFHIVYGVAGEEHALPSVLWAAFCKLYQKRGLPVRPEEITAGDQARDTVWRLRQRLRGTRFVIRRHREVGYTIGSTCPVRKRHRRRKVAA